MFVIQTVSAEGARTEVGFIQAQPARGSGIYLVGIYWGYLGDMKGDEPLCAVSLFLGEQIEE